MNMQGLEFLREIISRPDKGIETLRLMLPELEKVPDEELRLNAGELFDAANCRKRCAGCKGYLTCWRDGDAKGFITTLQVVGDKHKVQHITCKPYKVFMASERQKRLLDQTGMSAEDRIYTFDNYPVEQAKKHLRIVEHAQAFAEKIGDGNNMQGLYLFGSPGIGKTHLMRAVINRVIDRGIMAIYSRHDVMMDKLRDAARGESGELEDAITRYATVPVLGIDEFAQERMTDFALDKTIEIINARANKRLPTFFTSNFAPTDAFERLYSSRPEQIDALRSRIYMLSLAARMIGSDHRMLNLHNALGPEEEAID